MACTSCVCKVLSSHCVIIIQSNLCIMTTLRTFQSGLKGSVTICYIFVHSRLMSLFAKNL